MASGDQDATERKLRDYCCCNNREDFVGIRCERSETGLDVPKIHFPCGFFGKEWFDLSDDALRESVFDLFAALSDPDLQNEAKTRSEITTFAETPRETDFPIVAYLNVIRNFLDCGYIVEKEILYKRGAHGKVNWSRTIKTTRPLFDEKTDTPVYLDLVARKINHSEDSLITLVHRFCVHDALTRLGFLFGVEPTEEPSLEFDYDLFRNAIHAKLANTFIDHDLHLLSDLARIVEYLAEHRTDDGAMPNDFYFGVDKFAPLWEAMVDRIFGTEDASRYNPRIRFSKAGGSEENLEDSEEEETIDDHGQHRSTLRPDTIMRCDDAVFVLDAKYYKYGLTGNLKHLPGADSVPKQMVYAEYVEKNKGVAAKHIYNAFVLPYCKAAKRALPGKDVSTGAIPARRIGYIYGNWKELDQNEDSYRPYQKIVCILLDMKSVMRNYARNEKAQKELAQMIREGAK